jgi:23S rRNA-/tRNA-specific pseudouridylate synthase
LLPPPTIVYADNHLLAVNKPAGWHSVPNTPKQRKRNNRNNDRNNIQSNENRTAIGSKKCLLTHLQREGLGGGSNKDFLVPLHRIDQPCTGILLFGKTSKAASRVTQVWKGIRKKKKKRKQQQQQQQRSSEAGDPSSSPCVVKDYLCVVPTSRLGAMEEASIPVGAAYGDESTYSGFPDSVRHPLADGTVWNQLDGLMLRQTDNDEGRLPRQRQLQRRQQQQYYQERLRKGRSVQIVRRNIQGDGAGYDGENSFFDYDPNADSASMRPVRAMWKIVHVPTIEPSYTLLLVRTSEGARHMVRALLAQVGDCPILGDVRYWKAAGTNDASTDDTDDEKGPLVDRSVALHAYGVYFDQTELKLGSLDTFEFRAPVPPTWESFFGIDNNQLKHLL